MSLNRKGRPHTALPHYRPGPNGPVPDDGGMLAAALAVALLAVLVCLLAGVGLWILWGQA